MLRCEQLVKSYDQQLAVNHIDLTIKNGEFVAIMGPSGSGKSTLLNLLSGIDEATSGLVYFNQTAINRLKEKEKEELRQTKMGFIFQEYHVLNSLTARENIALPLTIQKINKNQILERVQMVANDLEIIPILDKYPYQLSGGERQRVAIARALITNPDILFADEPTGALDSKNAHRLLNSMVLQNQIRQITTVMVTHDPFSASFASRVVFIKDGKIFHEIEKGSTSRKSFYEQIIHVSTLLGGEFDAL